MPSKCNKCSSFLPTNGDCITCSTCNNNLHFECSGVALSTWTAMALDKRSTWKCKACREKKKPANVSDEKEDDPNTLLMNEIKMMRNAFESMKQSIEDNSNKLSEALGVILELRNENKLLKEENAQIKYRLDELEQYSRANNIIISNVPVVPHENTLQLVQNLGQVLGTEITANDIDACHRLRKTKNQTYPSIVVKFCRRVTKQAFIQNRRGKRITPDELGLKVHSNSQQIYINEHLTVANSKLLAEAKRLHDSGFKFIWSRGGKIFARRDPDSEVVRITSLEQIHNLVSPARSQQ